MNELHAVRVVDAAGGPRLPIVEGEGEARAIVWPGMGARHRSLHRITLAEGARTTALRHPMEAVYYVVEGSASVVDAENGSRQGLVEGAMVHIGPDTPYRFEASAGVVELVGGPCPPDPDLYRQLEG
jgi:mannose-6-phosphate isomerase-like protein (cupin superfamily)